MTETRKPSADMFDMWDRTVRSWSEFYGSYARMTGNFMPGYGVPGMEDWMRMYKGFADMGRGMPLPFQTMKDLNAAVARGMSSSMKICDTWVKEVQNMAKEAYDLNRKMASGEEVETGKFFESVRNSYGAVAASVAEAARDTPFSDVKDVDEAVRQLMGVLPEEQARGQEFFDKLLSLNVKAVNTSLSTMKEANKTFAHMLEEKTVTSNGFREALASYGDLMKDSVEVFRLSADLPEGSKDMADDIAAWARANVDLAVNWFEMNLKLSQGMFKSASDTPKRAEQLLRETNMESADQMYRLWADISREATGDLVNSSEYFESISKFIDSYTEWIKAGNKLYRDMMLPPFATRQDLERISEELRKVKSAVEKKAARAKLEEEPVK